MKFLGHSELAHCIVLESKLARRRHPGIAVQTFGQIQEPPETSGFSPWPRISLPRQGGILGGGIPGNLHWDGRIGVEERGKDEALQERMAPRPVPHRRPAPCAYGQRKGHGTACLDTCPYQASRRNGKYVSLYFVACVVFLGSFHIIIIP